MSQEKESIEEMSTLYIKHALKELQQSCAACPVLPALKLEQMSHAHNYTCE